jgi:hypothetical protein
MASHNRYTSPYADPVRTQIRFRRTDLLWKCPMVFNPHDHTAVEVPIRAGIWAVGPTILDMTQRKEVRWRVLPEHMRPDDVNLDEIVAVWAMRDTDTLWPPPGQPQKRRKSGKTVDEEDEEAVRLPDHPFFLNLASGGAEVAGSSEGFLRVSKYSTVTISLGVFRVLVAMTGSVDAAYSHIAALASQAWEEDVERSLRLWAAIQAAGGVLLEEQMPGGLRPNCSVSQAVERDIMRQACQWMGVAPDIDISRPKGRPRKAAGDEGDVLRMELRPDGTVIGTLKQAFHGLDADTSLADLSLMALVELLGALRTNSMAADADLLEAYLDAAATDWREQAAAQAAEGETATIAANDNPYDVLGVTPDMPMADIATAFRAVMQAIQHLPNAAPQRRLIAAYKAIKTLHKDAA